MGGRGRAGPMPTHSSDVRGHRGGWESPGCVLLRGDTVDEEGACRGNQSGAALTQMLTDLCGERVAASLRPADNPLHLVRICDVASVQSRDCGQPGADLDHHDA